MINNYYIYFNIKDNIDYYNLLKLYTIASYNKLSRRYDTIRYKTQIELAERLKISASTIGKMLSDNKYNAYFSVDKKQKLITIHNDFMNNHKPFVVLNNKEVDYILSVEAERLNLFVKYYLYIKYYCGMYKNKEQDFTANQFLSFVGLSTNSNNQKNLIGKYNNIIRSSGFIKIRPGKDHNGHSRNYYSLT